MYETSGKNQPYHYHGCKECNKYVVKSGSRAICTKPDDFTKCDDHKGSCHSAKPVPSMSKEREAPTRSFLRNLCSLVGRGDSRIDAGEQTSMEESKMFVATAWGNCLNGACLYRGPRCQPYGFCPGCCVTCKHMESDHKILEPTKSSESSPTIPIEVSPPLFEIKPATLTTTQDWS